MIFDPVPRFLNHVRYAVLENGVLVPKHNLAALIILDYIATLEHQPMWSDDDEQIYKWRKKNKYVVGYYKNGKCATWLTNDEFEIGINFLTERGYIEKQDCMYTGEVLYRINYKNIQSDDILAKNDFDSYVEKITIGGSQNV